MTLFPALSETEWKQKEEFYATKLKEIKLPPEPSPGDIKLAESQIDELFTLARLDLANCKRQRDYYDRKFKLAHKEAYLVAKDEGKTEKERDSLAASFLSNNCIDNMSFTVYEAVSIAENRYCFMEAVVDILKEKHGRCITDSGVMKLEADLQP